MPNGLVYVVSYGEKHEGSTVAAICDNHSRALEVALNEVERMKQWDNGEVIDSDYWDPNPNVRIWSLSCDYVQIKTMTINHYSKGE